MTTYERIQNAAKKRGMNLRQVAKAAGMKSETAIYRYNQGVTPRESTLRAIADVLGVSVDYLLGNTDEMHPADNRTVEQKLSDEGMAIATYIDPNAELDEQAMDNIKNYIYEQTMLAKMRIDKERAKNGK